MSKVIDISDRFMRHKERIEYTVAEDAIYTPAELDYACDIEAKRAYFVAYAAMDEYWRQVMARLDGKHAPLVALLKQEYEDTVGFELYTRGK